MTEAAPSTERRAWLGAADLFVGLSMLIAVWVALPARWWPVDVVGTLLGALFTVSGAGLVAGARWARRVGLVAGGVALVIGMALVTALTLSAAQLTGLYGPVGRGGALILAVVTLMVVPYLVALPAAQLAALRRR